MTWNVQICKEKHVCHLLLLWGSSLFLNCMKCSDLHRTMGISTFHTVLSKNVFSTLPQPHGLEVWKRWFSAQIWTFHSILHNFFCSLTLMPMRVKDWKRWLFCAVLDISFNSWQNAFYNLDVTPTTWRVELVSMTFLCRPEHLMHFLQKCFLQFDFPPHGTEGSQSCLCSSGYFIQFLYRGYAKLPP